MGGVTGVGDPVVVAGHQECGELRSGCRDGGIGGRQRVGWVVDEHAVAQLHAVVLVGVGDVPGDREVCVPCGGPVDADGDGVEELGDGQRRSEARAVDVGVVDGVGPKLLGAGEEAVAPGRVLCAVAELLEG